jgi:hypothetical protein
VASSTNTKPQRNDDDRVSGPLRCQNSVHIPKSHGSADGNRVFAPHRAAEHLGALLSEKRARPAPPRADYQPMIDQARTGENNSPPTASSQPQRASSGLSDFRCKRVCHCQLLLRSIRPSKVIANAFSAAFQRVTQRCVARRCLGDRVNLDGVVGDDLGRSAPVLRRSFRR